MRPIITLTTDFGNEDEYAGVVKGVILARLSDVHIVDISHQISPQNIRQAALVLARAVPHFPEGTVHLAVVDPGVGSSRRAMAAVLGDQLFVGPDNGLVTFIAQAAWHALERVEMVELWNESYWLSTPSRVFHGRDIFAPVAAYLAEGGDIENLGPPIKDPVLLPLPSVTTEGSRLKGEVLNIDHFGNIATNITSHELGEEMPSTVQIGSVTITTMVSGYGEGNKSDLVALINSSGALEIAEVDGNAADRLKVQPGDEVLVEPG